MPRDARYSGKMAALTDGLCILFTQLEYEKIKRENYGVCEFRSCVLKVGLVLMIRKFPDFANIDPTPV